jgi:hypothetical protein
MARFAADERLITPPSARRQRAKVRVVQPCGFWGNDQLAFAWVNASYETTSALGHKLVLLAFRRAVSGWKLLIASQDPISNTAFVKALKPLPMPEARNELRVLPARAILLSPASGIYPQPASGLRFGTFTWQPSSSSDVAIEIAEFAYGDDARLFLKPPRESNEVVGGTTLDHTKSLEMAYLVSQSRRRCELL